MAIEASQARDRLARELEEELGPDWYDIHLEATRIVTEREPIWKKLWPLNNIWRENTKIMNGVFEDETLTKEEQQERYNAASEKRQAARLERKAVKERIRELRRQVSKELKAAREAQAKSEVATDDGDAAPKAT
ncbi:hypothetical protein M406DRAFT_356244 [Cryphonectria parasitica EP155]|uniref:Uncharacterized protein n=1 Tax=Cryphonectria parasitica (strain ATCC 38755 / EP155) TaxID=660469 RepID=A0A9P4Y411_CRYP1|nr:uncharacterized protein M406DRAFT_356244 [Cryphonectria parasitica EP155]KAF3766231.1 hypothetical protein M406DRAFT_356244 [Cryphonectria parasitica EP155]